MSSESIKAKGLKNGAILANQKPTCNFETNDYSSYYMGE